MLNQSDEYKQALKYEAKLELARRCFWDYCKLREPDFYLEERLHLKQLCETLQKLYDGSLLDPDGKAYRKLIINMPPQHGKSRTLVNFCQWVLGQNQEERIIEASYNDDAAGDFAKYTRDGIAEEKNTLDQTVFSDIFPEVRLKFGTKSYYKWALEGQHFNYIGAGVGGSITGKGATIRIVDDPVKSADIALNEDALEKIYLWYTSTLLSRIAAKGGDPIDIIVMTRWSKKDLCGRLLADPEELKKWYILKLVAYDEQADTMLCPSLLSKESYLNIKRLMLDEIFKANYQQEPMDVKGRLYKSFKTYDKLPTDDKGNSVIEQIRNYTDTADEGECYLCSIDYAVYNKEAYILDILYTQEPMEITEPATAEMLKKDHVAKARIESNNGGKGFARNVERILNNELKSNYTSIEWFHQSQNKIARILTNSTFVQNHIYFPANWKDRWPEYYESMTTFQKDGKNKFLDGPDATTGIAEDLNAKTEFDFF